MNKFERVPQPQSPEDQPTPELLSAELEQELEGEELALFNKLQGNPELARRFADYSSAEASYAADEPNAGLAGEGAENEAQRLSTLREQLLAELGTTDAAMSNLMQRIEAYQDSKRGNSQSAAA